MDSEQESVKAAKDPHRTKGVLLCMACIFLGSCAENTISNWISVYTETVLNIPKVWGDIFGMSLFAILLAMTRTVYAKRGKNILKTLMLSMVGAAVCYLAIALSPSSIFSLLACVALGIFTSMLWPGTLILMEEKISAVGVAAYALMAAGGDFGASLAPQALGILVDNIALTPWAQSLGQLMALSPEQVGFKLGMLTATLFPIAGFLLLLYMKKFFQRSTRLHA